MDKRNAMIGHGLDEHGWRLLARTAAGALAAGFLLGVGATSAYAPERTTGTARVSGPAAGGTAWTAEHAAIVAEPGAPLPDDGNEAPATF